MIFTDIRLQNFRSYSDASFDFSPNVNIVVGPNAAGKTNLIEALLICATFKTYKDDGFIKNNEPWARLDTHTNKNQLRTVKYQINNEKLDKTFEIEGKKYKRLPDDKKQPTVLFEPNDLSLLHGDPSGRRKFLDDLSAQIVLGYKTALNRYKRVLLQRNSLLKSLQRPNDQLFVWDVKLVELASELVRARNHVIKKIDEVLSEKYSKIADKKSKVNIYYESKINSADYSGVMMKSLEKNAEMDVLRGFTSVGPHRDDLGFLFDKKVRTSEASRGESRSLVLALKLIELDLLEQKNGDKPLLLLDDVFSELDGKRRKALTVYLKGHQTVITTTDADIVLKNFSKNTQIIAI